MIKLLICCCLVVSFSYRVTSAPYYYDYGGDEDNDGVPDSEDLDDDNDGILDSEDHDDDNDGVPDYEPRYGYGTNHPANRYGSPDWDEDGDGDDGEEESYYRTTTSSYRYGRYNYKTTATPRRNSRYGYGTTASNRYGSYDGDNDYDKDGIPNSVDTDDDGDGIPDSEDLDDDNDGIFDGEDPDDDNDGILDSDEPDYNNPRNGYGTIHPANRYGSPDWDEDGDEDDDNDGVPDWDEDGDGDDGEEESYYNYGEPYTPPDLLGFLPTPVRDWLDKSVKQLEDMAHEIVRSKEKTVTEFINKTMGEGETVVLKLWDEVMDKTEDNKQDFISTISDVHEKVFAIPQSFIEIWSRDEPLDAKELVDNEESLENIKKKLNDFEKKVEEEIQKEKDLPFALRNQLVKFITTSRDMVKKMGKEEESFWNKLKLIEKEMFQFQLTASEASEGLKNTLDSLFVALKKVDLPMLNSVKQSEKKLGEVDDFISKFLTD